MNAELKSQRHIRWMSMGADSVDDANFNEGNNEYLMSDSIYLHPVMLCEPYGFLIGSTIRYLYLAAFEEQFTDAERLYKTERLYRKACYYLSRAIKQCAKSGGEFELYPTDNLTAVQEEALRVFTSYVPLLRSLFVNETDGRINHTSAEDTLEAVKKKIEEIHEQTSKFERKPEDSPERLRKREDEAEEYASTYHPDEEVTSRIRSEQV